jgi:hypothetical protein
MGRRRKISLQMSSKKIHARWGQSILCSYCVVCKENPVALTVKATPGFDFSPLQLPYPPNALCENRIIVVESLSNGKRPENTFLEKFQASVTTKRASKIRRAQETLRKCLQKRRVHCHHKISTSG